MHVDIAERISKHFPIGQVPVSLEVVAGATGEWNRSETPRAVATVRLIVWDVRDDGTQSIRDIKEQELDMGLVAYYDNDERAGAFFGALATVLAELCRGGIEIIETLMPHDLLCTDALGLKRAQTREDFESALRAKSRLGQYLG